MFAPIKMLASRIGGWFSRKRVDEDFDQELRAHLEMLTQENIQRGMTREEASRAARVRLGGVAQLREINREMWGLPFLDSFMQDVRYAFRMLRKSPGFAVVAILTLALGIGANTAIFSVVQAIYLRTLPVEHPEQLVLLHWDISGWPRDITQSGYGNGNSLSYSAFQDFRAKNSTLASVFGFTPFGFDSANTNVIVNGQGALVDGTMVTGDFFSGLGVRPALGRAIDEEDDGESKPRVAVLGYSYWANHFVRDPGVIGTTIIVNNLPCIIIGVAPPAFQGPIPGHHFDVYVSLSDGIGLKPYGYDSQKNLLHDDKWFWLTTMGRVKPDVNAAAVQADLESIFRRSVATTTLEGYKLKATPYMSTAPASNGLDVVRKQFVDPVTLLECMVALILLMTCANIAALLIARAMNRTAEMGIRMALGASHSRLVGQLLIENLILAIAGAALGLAFTQWSSRTLVLLLSPNGEPLHIDTHLEMRTLLFAAGLALFTTVLFGLGPSISAAKIDVISSLKESSRNGLARSGASRTRSVLVCAQIAISLVLLTGAGLFLRSMRSLENENLGFNRQDLLLFGVNPTQIGYNAERRGIFYRDLQARIEELPGVSSASPSNLSLISGWVNNGSIAAEGVPSNADLPTVYNNQVGTHFFTTMGIPVTFGRDFDARDMDGATHVAVVNQTFARQYWPNLNPLGRRFSFGKTYRPGESLEVIGIVQDAKFGSVSEKAHATAYSPFVLKQATSRSVHFAVKTYGDASALIPAVRNIVREMDPALPLYGVKTETQQIDETLSTQRMFARLSTFFGALALLLASLGLYGLLAYTVGQRTHEFGIRMALGASRRNILVIVLKSGLWLGGVGVVIGLGGALASSRLLRKFLYGVQPNDPWTFITSALVLIAVALIACWIPARRATRVDPMIALRYE